MYGSLADTKHCRQLLYLFSLGVQPQYLFISQLLYEVLFPSGLVVDASGEGAVKTGAGKITTFIPIVAVLRG